MGFGVKVNVWGDWACFTRPEMKVERVSYDVITPSAARAVLEAIYWKPAIRWIIDRIHVLKPIRFSNIRRNEVDGKLAPSAIKRASEDGSAKLEVLIEERRQQRAAMVLRDVAYVIEAHFEAVTNDGVNKGKHLDQFNRRLEKGRCFYQPYLGTREFSAHFSPVEKIPVSALKGEKDLGWMLYDMNFTDKNNIQPMFFKANMVDGIINVPHPDSAEVHK